jgi:protein disulfide-isomerase A1
MYPTLRLFQGLDHETIYNGAREPSEYVLFSPRHVQMSQTFSGACLAWSRLSCWLHVSLEQDANVRGSMISFAEVRTQPAVQLLTRNELEIFKDSANVVVVGSWSKSDTASNETFSRIADELIDYYTFGATNDKAEDERPSITLYKQYDSRKLHFDGDFEEDAIIDFIALNSVPLVGDYTQKWSWYYPSNVSHPSAVSHKTCLTRSIGNCTSCGSFRGVCRRADSISGDNATTREEVRERLALRDSGLSQGAYIRGKAFCPRRTKINAPHS